MKDFNVYLRRKQNGIVEPLQDESAFILALQDIIETHKGENPDDPNRGTVIESYLKSSPNTLNALIIEEKINDAIEKYLKTNEFQNITISVEPDTENNEYIIKVTYEKTEDLSQKELVFSLNVYR